MDMHIWRLATTTLTIGARPLVMGIVNVTPDSFFDGGRHSSRESAIAHGIELASQGADLLDVGGESTRPGARAVPAEEELHRVVPVVKQLVRQAGVPVSVDTSKAVVARQCLDLGAQIINDVTALAGDAQMKVVVSQARAGLVLMHMQGTPETMQLAPAYDDVVADLARFFRQRLKICRLAGIQAEQIALDPGIGFGKTLEHTLGLLGRLEEFKKLKRPVLLGVSRKGFIGQVTGRPREQRLVGSLATVCFAAARESAQIMRVHDVVETREAMELCGKFAERRIKPSTRKEQ